MEPCLIWEFSQLGSQCSVSSRAPVQLMGWALPPALQLCERHTCYSHPSRASAQPQGVPPFCHMAACLMGALPVPFFVPCLGTSLFPAEIPSRSHLASYFLTSGLARTVTCVLSQEPVSYIWKTCFFYSIWLGLFFFPFKKYFFKAHGEPHLLGIHK